MENGTPIPEKQTYDPVAKTFHWVIALLIIGLLCLGLYMDTLEFSPSKLQLYDLHKSFGITVLLLISLRLLWRLSRTYPLHLLTHKKWEKVLARLTHVALYICAFAMPLSGWAMSSSSGYGAHIFGLFNLPAITPESKDLTGLFKEIHALTAWGLIGLIGLHFAGALKHHMIDKDATLRRMLPFVKPVIVAALVIVSLGGQEAQAAPQSWTVQPWKSSLEFSGVQRGEAFSGSFGKWDAVIAFDADDLEVSSVTATINTEQVSSKIQDVAGYVTGAAWLDAAQYPEATFVSKSFSKTDDTHFTVTGDFTLKGVTKEISFPFTLVEGEENSRVMDAQFPVKRLDYGVGSGDWVDTAIVGDTVMIKLHMIAVPQD
ncbi:MAG: cytochrome b/b6 domain-containing protein [Pseudobdellovibrionaceae bacterium]